MANVDLAGMSIKRLIAHTIHARGHDKNLVPPDCSEGLMKLDVDSLDLIQLRITEALIHQSHGIEAEIQNTGPGSFLQTGAEMIQAVDDARFVLRSKDLAMGLARAQTHPKWPGGILIVISGTVGRTAKNFLAAIKAETDKGFNFEESPQGISLTLVKKMLLSTTQRLYKIGLLVELNAEPPNADGLFDVGHYRSFLFDHLLTPTETKSAAAYFYSSFLGMDILKSDKHFTRLYLEEGGNYINAQALEGHEKDALREALRADLRSNSPTINPRDFAKVNLPEEHQDRFVAHLERKGFPNRAVAKDLDYIKSKLRRQRRVTFSNGVQLRVPGDKEFREFATIAAPVEGVTQIAVQGIVQDHE